MKLNCNFKALNYDSYFSIIFRVHNPRVNETCVQCV